MATDIFKKSFKTGSKTFYNSALFFPKEIRRQTSVLYAFVRKADNFVDSVPQDERGFYQFRESFYQALAGKAAGDRIISEFVQLFRVKQFQLQWVEAFFHSMEMDLHKSCYNSPEEFLEYAYGSAEVIGFFMAKIMNLESEAMPYAALLGRSFQLINTLRDIREDFYLGRRYIWLSHYRLTVLSEEECFRNRAEFISLIKERMNLFFEWHQEAQKGYRFIPRPMLLAIKTAADLYCWTGRQILKNPFVVFAKKVKPSKPRILLTFLKNLLTLCYHKKWKKF